MHSFTFTLTDIDRLGGFLLRSPHWGGSEARPLENGRYYHSSPGYWRPSKHYSGVLRWTKSGTFGWLIDPSTEQLGYPFDAMVIEAVPLLGGGYRLTVALRHEHELNRYIGLGIELADHIPDQRAAVLRSLVESLPDPPGELLRLLVIEQMPARPTSSPAGGRLVQRIPVRGGYGTGYIEYTDPLDDNTSVNSDPAGGHSADNTPASNERPAEHPTLADYFNEQKTLDILHDWHKGYTANEIGEKVGLSPGRVRNIVGDKRKQLTAQAGRDITLQLIPYHRR